MCAEIAATTTKAGKKRFKAETFHYFIFILFFCLGWNISLCDVARGWREGGSGGKRKQSSRLLFCLTPVRNWSQNSKVGHRVMCLISGQWMWYIVSVHLETCCFSFVLLHPSHTFPTFFVLIAKKKWRVSGLCLVRFPWNFIWKKKNSVKWREAKTPPPSSVHETCLIYLSFFMAIFFLAIYMFDIDDGKPTKKKEFSKIRSMCLQFLLDCPLLLHVCKRYSQYYACPSLSPFIILYIYSIIIHII